MPSRRAIRLAAACIGAAALFGPAGAGGPQAAASATRFEVFLTVEEALELVFEDCVIERSTEFFDDERKERVAKLAKVDFERGLVYPYRATRDGELVGTAYIDKHRVRSLYESVLFVVGPDASIARLELLAFGEPPEYVPNDAWYAQLLGRQLDGELFLGKAIRNVTGATLTARATVDAARRVLAAHRVIELDRAAEERRRREEEERDEEEGDEPAPQPDPEPAPDPKPEPEPVPDPTPAPGPTPRPQPPARESGGNAHGGNAR